MSVYEKIFTINMCILVCKGQHTWKWVETPESYIQGALFLVVTLISHERLVETGSLLTGGCNTLIQSKHWPWSPWNKKVHLSHLYLEVSSTSTTEIQTKYQFMTHHVWKLEKTLFTIDLSALENINFNWKDVEPDWLSQNKSLKDFFQTKVNVFHQRKKNKAST